ncbi:heavy-metal-associated domain-containing protein [Aquincola sp. J276]|nr:heavy-metal-associated domain-containing protein [Aquincola sp. J276]
MDCRNEEAVIQARLAGLPGVESLSFDLPGRRMTVVHMLATPQALLGALAEIGMEAALDVEAMPVPTGSCGSSCSSTPPRRRRLCSRFRTWTAAKRKQPSGPDLSP